MDSKEGIEQVAPINARAVGLLDPSLLRSGKDDAATAHPPRERAGGPVGSPTSPGENTRWESCCLYVRVLRDSNIVLEQDHKMLDYCWNAGISKDICKPEPEYCWAPSLLICWVTRSFCCINCPRQGEECPRRNRCCSRISLWEVTCGLVFRLTYSSHRELSRKQEGIRLKHVIITVGLWWSD